MKFLIYSFIALLSTVGATPLRSRDIPTCIPSVLRRATPQDTIENPRPIKASTLSAPSVSDKVAKGHPRAKKNRNVSSFGVVFQLPKGITDLIQLPLFERAIVIIKAYETNHKSRHWPYIGFGHRVLPGDPYKIGQELTDAQAEILLRKDFKKFCHMYAAYGKDSVLLGALAYNCGPGVVNKSSVLKKLKQGNRDIAASYAAHCRYKGKPHKGLRSRRLAELRYLFVP